jgi:hypothetical protein
MSATSARRVVTLSGRLTPANAQLGNDTVTKSEISS